MIISDIKTHYIEKGQGAVVLVLPGWGGSAESWKEFFDEFDFANKRIIVLDLPGFGKTDEPTKAFTVEDYTEFVKKFCDELGIDNAEIIGHSNGGRIAVRLAAQTPTLVDRLALIAPAGIKHNEKTAVKGIKNISGTSKKLLGNSWLGKQIKKLVYKLMGTHDYEKASPIMRKTMLNMLSDDTTPLLSQIKQPTLVIWGNQDTYIPVSDTEIYRKEIPQAEIRVINGKHGLHKFNTKETIDILRDFL